MQSETNTDTKMISKILELQVTGDIQTPPYRHLRIRGPVAGYTTPQLHVSRARGGRDRVQATHTSHSQVVS